MLFMFTRLALPEIKRLHPIGGYLYRTPDKSTEVAFVTAEHNCQNVRFDKSNSALRRTEKDNANSNPHHPVHAKGHWSERR
jgi:hypothetical protein